MKLTGCAICFLVSMRFLTWLPQGDGAWGKGLIGLAGVVYLLGGVMIWRLPTQK